MQIVSYHANMRQMLKKRAAAQYLDISLGTLERLMRGDLSYIKVGNGRTGSVRFTLDDLNDYIERRRVRPEPVPQAGTTA